jgi:hypothetical protein
MGSGHDENARRQRTTSRDAMLFRNVPADFDDGDQFATDFNVNL